MAYISYKEIWESEFDGIFSKSDRLQDLNINQLKFQVQDTYEKDEKITTTFEPIDNEDIINKAYPDKKLNRLDGYISYIEKDCNDFKNITTNNLLKKF